MSLPLSLLDNTPDELTREEWRLRLELATCYRLFDKWGWTSQIFNHISLRVPGGSDPQFLINPFGLNYREVTARNLVKVDVHGEKVIPSDYHVNAAGFVIHGAIHAARPDAHCIAHTHTLAGMAVACKAQGLTFDNFNAALLYGQVAYHDFEGVTTGHDEGPRLVADLGSKNILILRNHGLLVAGSDVPDMLWRMLTLEKACQIQVLTSSMSGATLPISEEILSGVGAQTGVIFENTQPQNQMVFDAALRAASISYVDVSGL